MKRRAGLYLISLLSGFFLFACERNEGVHAASGDTYQPRVLKRPQRDSHEMNGELIRVDKSGKTIGIRVDNGMLQTFDVNGTTTVVGLGDTSVNDVRDLAGKEGSEVIVHWEGQEGIKSATTIKVTQLSTSKSARLSRRRRL